ncbi:MAG: hypothetical protein OEL57_05725 [Trichlorobacter sp.]|uniref:hypothetical protein n=1 Tax=Trichlorobacter sp. TaxID=2911007 RepID=UPI00256B8C83|nr:hypothetical protein [Trichlorobacter sp.]MDK9717393.1 hypothetical protein [Trichlorobacter sp.]
MDERYYWPIVGVLVGWLLNTITNHSKFRVEQKMHSGKALTYLMIIHSQLSILNKHLERLKDLVDSWEEYEPLRAHQVQKHFLASEDLLKNVEVAFVELSGVNPILADKLIGMKNVLEKYRSSKLSQSSKSTEIYIQLLSAQEAVNELLEKKLLNEIYWLAVKYDLVTWFRVLLKYRTRKNIEDSKVLDGAFSILKQMQSKSEKNTNDAAEGSSERPNNPETAPTIGTTGP